MVHMITIILVLSVLLQLIAAIMAIRLIFITGKKTAWVLIATAIMLMVIRRCIPLGHLFSADTAFQPDLDAEVIGFVISLLIVVGITRIAPIFTEHKRAEDALLSSLQEKELLIREVHHRVKNNMQVMSGLLDLQASSSGDPELTAMLNVSQKRIRAMALVHEKLYDSKDFARIGLAGYVRNLSQELLQAYRINPGKIDLVIQADDAAYVDISKATPCGLILNELISNALKHAFPGDEPGKLEIIIGKTKKTEIEIIVRDNGPGLPDDVDIHQPRSVGLHLVNGLVINQLDGRIEVRRNGGTEFRISFPSSFVEKEE